MSRLVDLRTMADVIVFKSIRFQVSVLIRYVCVSICIHFQQRFLFGAFSVNTLSVFERISVAGRPKRIEMYAFSNENAQVWTGPNTCASFASFVIVLRKLLPLVNPMSTKAMHMTFYWLSDNIRHGAHMLTSCAAHDNRCIGLHG